MIFETHAHYDDEVFNEDREQLLAGLPEKGIGRVINVGASIETTRTTLALAEAYDYIYAAVGVHPSDIDGLNEETYSWLKAQTAHPKTVAVGEIGLDYYWDKEPEVQAAQREWFVRQLTLAGETDLPVIIHSRDAAEDTMRILKETGRFREHPGVIHCYSYSPEQAKEYYDKAVEELGSAPSEVTLLVADDSVSKSVATFIQSELVTTLGLNVVIDTKTVQGRGELMDANNYQFAVTAWGADYDDAMTYLDLWTNGTPYRGNYNDADYNALISDAKTQTDDAARLDDMLKAEKKLVEEDAVVAPVYHRGSAVLTKSNVKNLISHPIGVPLEFKYASFE